MICKDKVIPRRNPIFHSMEIDLGDGRSDRDAFKVFIKKCVFISCFFIKRMSLVSGGVCGRVSRLRLS